MEKKLIKLLYDNARLSTTELADILGVTEEEVVQAMDKLEAQGKICGYKAVLNWEKIDASYLTALIELKVIPQKGAGYEELAQKILSFDEVESLYLISGGFDFAVIVRGKSFQQVARFVGSCLAPMDGVVSTGTHFMLHRYKEMNVDLSDTSEDDRGSYSL